MSKYILAILLVSLFTLHAVAEDGTKDELTINTTESIIQWTARKVTGKHTGTVSVKEGKVEMNDGIMTKANITIDMTSITVEELTGKSKTDLEGDLKSDRFFGVEKFPTASLVTTSVIGIDEGDYRITANLTIRGITHPITFDAQVIPDGKKYRARANLVVDRTLYEVRYGSGKFYDDLGDATIYDDFDLKISLTIE